MKTIVNWDIPLLKQMLKKYLLTVVFVSCIVTVLGVLGISHIQKPTYSSSVQFSQNDNNVAQLPSYSQFIQTDDFQQQLRSKITSSKWKHEKYSVALDYANDSVFFTISAKSPDPVFSQFLASQAMLIFTTNMGNYLSGVNISIVSKPKLNNVPDKMNFVKVAIVFFVISIVVLSLCAFMLELFVGKVYDEGYMLRTYNLASLGELDIEKQRASSSNRER